MCPRGQTHLVDSRVVLEPSSPCFYFFIGSSKSYSQITHLPPFSRKTFHSPKIISRSNDTHLRSLIYSFPILRKISSHCIGTHCPPPESRLPHLQRSIFPSLIIVFHTLEFTLHAPEQWSSALAEN